MLTEGRKSSSLQKQYLLTSAVSTFTRRAAIGAVLLGIALITLRPKPDATIRGCRWCVACGEFGTLDRLLNIALFAPFGALLVRLRGWSRRDVALIAAALSIGIELAQLHWVAGRDASLSDVVGNTFGGVGGAAAMRVAPRLAHAGARAWRLMS